MRIALLDPVVTCLDLGDDLEAEADLLDLVSQLLQLSVTFPHLGLQVLLDICVDRLDVFLETLETRRDPVSPIQFSGKVRISRLNMSLKLRFQVVELLFNLENFVRKVLFVPQSARGGQHLPDEGRHPGLKTNTGRGALDRVGTLVF